MDDIQEYAVDSIEDLASSADSFVTAELDSDATVVDIPYGDVCSGVDLQSMDDSTPEISDSEVTPLDSVPEEEDCRRQISQRHHVSSQLRVSERDIAVACEHFDAARQLLAVYGWGSPTSDEQGGSHFSLTEIHSLWEAIRILRQDYMQLVADRDHLIEWGSTAYEALLVKEEEVSELTQQLEVTSEILESTQLAFEESQFRLAEVTMELGRLQSSSVSIQSQTMATGDPRISMVEVDRGSRDEDISILDTSIGTSSLFPLQSGSVELGAEHCGVVDLVVISTSDGVEIGEDELIGSFYWYYISGYVHQLAYESCMEEMADRFVLSDCYPLYDAYQPPAEHGSYGDASMVGNLQRYDDYSWCTVCGFSALGAVPFRSIHHCYRAGLSVGCVGDNCYVGSFSCPLYLGSEIFRVGVSWVPDYGSYGVRVQLSSGSRFIHGFLLIILQRILQELALVDCSIVHDFIWDPGGLMGSLFSHCLGTSNFRRGGLSCPHFG